MRIAFIGQKGMPTKSGGVERHVENLALFLAKKGQEVIVYNRRGYLPENISEWQGVTIVTKPFINTMSLAAISHYFLATIDALRRKVDAIHFHGIGSSLLAWMPRLFAPKTKVIATLHSFDYGNDKWGAFAKAMLKLGEKFMCRYAHQVIVLTGLMHDYLWQRHQRESVIIPNGASVTADSGSNYLLPLGLERGKYIISVSRLIRLKGLQYLIPAFKAANLGDLKLAIVGDGEYQEELEKLAGNDPRIVFTGAKSGAELNQIFSGAKLFVQSSEMEGLSISLLEAMAHGLPCLVSDIVANREAAAETAEYFESKDIEDLEKRLRSLMSDEEKLNRLGEMGKARAEKLFDWDLVSEKVLALYRSQD